MISTIDELRDLLARCALRDAKALEQLYALASPKLFAVILNMVRRRDIAEDILQDSFINIWNNADRYRADKSAPMTWMSRIVRNRTIDWLRCQPKQEIGHEDADEMAGTLSFESASDSNFALHECLDELESTQRRAILQVYFRGLTHRELAERWGDPLGTIKSWIRRGLEKLRLCLEP